MNLLWSYVYARNANMVRVLTDDLGPREASFFADSGAFSARTLGINLSVDDYAAWLRKWHGCFTVYANLDVIHAHKITRENQHRLEDGYGLHPMPVFHTGTPWSVLEKYLTDGYTYIALGKLLGNPWTKVAPWLEKAFRIAGDTAVYHGFGVTAWPAIREFPFYSVDSSSWCGSFRYGKIRLFNRGRWTVIHLRDRESVRANLSLIRDYGLPVTPFQRGQGDHLMAGGNDSRIRLHQASAEAYLRAQEWVADQHGPIVLPPGKGYPPRRNRALPNGGPTIHRAGHNQRFTLYLTETGIQGHQAHARAYNERSQ